MSLPIIAPYRQYFIPRSPSLRLLLPKLYKSISLDLASTNSSPPTPPSFQLPGEQVRPNAPIPSAALLASTSAVPASRNRGSAVSQGRQLSASPQLQPVEYEAPSNSLEPLLARQLFRHSPANAQLLSAKPALTGIISRLPDNATLLRPNIKDTFSCIGRTYGYYADPDNDCQIFHVCLPLHSLYPTLFKTQTTYHFSFICGNQTSFDQASMACVHKDSFTCDNPEMYYYLNYNFFRKVKTPEGEERWAWVNEDVPKGFAPEKPGSASVKPGSASVSVSVPVPVPTGRK